MIRPQTILELVNQCPPFLLPALARRDGALHKGMSRVELSAKAGVPMRTLERIISGDTWDRVDVRTISRLFEAANVDVMRMSRYREYIKQTNSARVPFRHLKHQPRQRAVLFARMARFAQKLAAKKAAGAG